MKFMITSWRGHHGATIDDIQIQKDLFNKLTGLRKEPLPEEYKTKIPDNFQELEALWKTGKMEYDAINVDKGEWKKIREFNSQVQELVFLAPKTGG